MNYRPISIEERRLLLDLRSSNEWLRVSAAARLWKIWFSEKGPVARELIEKGTLLMESGRNGKALDLFDDLILKFPDFAEAHNKKATVLFLMNRFEESIQSCLKTVLLNPIHFGAWHGLGLCYMEVGQLQSAAKAFREALKIQPFAEVNQQLIRRCQASLN